MIREAKGWFLGAGIILIIVGLAAITLPFAATIALEVILGWLFVIGGIVQSVHSFRALSTGRCILRLLSGILYFAIGIVFLVYPLRGVLTLTLLVCILFTFEGLIKISVALQNRSMLNWGWLLASGIAALVIAAIIWAGWPSSAAWAIGLLVGINLIFGGWTMIMLATVPSDQ